MPEYFLSPHAFVCFTNRHAVFLDLHRDRYSALCEFDAAALHGWVAGWPAFRHLHRSRPEERASEVIAALLEACLLTVDGRVGKGVSPLTVQAVVAAAGSPRGAARIGIGHVAAFLRAWALVTLMLRFWPLERAVARIERRKALSAGSCGEPDVEAMCGLARVYARLQPRFFSPIDACLRNSLTLVEFLAGYGLHPTWVFGVRLDPFAAHSWVQAGGIVLHDPVPHVRTFEPIMAV